MADSGDTPGTPTKKNAAWTEQERFQLLLALVKSQGGFGPIKWTDVELPPGRTVKACQLALDSIKKTFGGDDKAGAKRKADDGDGGSPMKKATPKKTAGAKARKLEGGTAVKGGAEE